MNIRPGIPLFGGYGDHVVVKSLLFVHSPLVGPSSLRRLANLAAAGGAEVALPDLTPMVRADRPHEDYARRAIEAGGHLTPPVAVVGHSGAGPFLPSIGAALSPDTVLVFVDAVMPPRSGWYRTPDTMREVLDRQTWSGMLRRWLDWWPAEVVSEVLPDPADREELAADMPCLPRAFFDEEVAVPPSWSLKGCGYIQLSAAYDADHGEAVARRWPAVQLQSSHLAIHTESARVLRAIVDVIDRISTPPD